MSAQINKEEPAPGDSFGFNERRTRQVLFLELFVAVSLSVAFFFLVRSCFVTGDPINRYIFTSASHSLFRLDQPLMGMHWNGRLGGLLLSGAFVDAALNQSAAPDQNTGRMSDAFALYHTLWLFLLFVAVIFALRDSLLINLGVFAGLMYDFSPVSGPYFYPWDLPAMFFFTMAALFFERKMNWPMVATICMGCFFKETVLVCALLVFFTGDWTWKKRAMIFIGMVAVYVLGKRLLLGGLHLPAPVFSMGDAATLTQAFNPLSLMDNFVDNLKVLFSPTINSVIFANAGTLIAVLVLCWRKRYLPYMTLILAYLAGLVFLPLKPPGITEVRVFMQVLPLSVILLSDWRMRLFQPGPSVDLAIAVKPKWATRGTVSLLLPMVVTVMLICAGVMAWRYSVIAEVVTDYNGQLEQASTAMKSGQFSDALEHEELALKANASSIEALNNVAWLLATAPDAKLRNGAEALRLAERACELTHNQEPVPLCTLAAAYAEAGRFDDAVATAQTAIQLAQQKGETNVAQKSKEMLQLYLAHKPYRLEQH